MSHFFLSFWHVFLLENYSNPNTHPYYSTRDIVADKDVFVDQINTVEWRKFWWTFLGIDSDVILNIGNFISEVEDFLLYYFLRKVLDIKWFDRFFFFFSHLTANSAGCYPHHLDSSADINSLAAFVFHPASCLRQKLTEWMGPQGLVGESGCPQLCGILTNWQPGEPWTGS